MRKQLTALGANLLYYFGLFLCPSENIRKPRFCDFFRWYRKRPVAWNGSINCEVQKKSVCDYHVTYAFQSESTLYTCLNVKKPLAQSRREIWSLSDCNWTRTHNHLVRKKILLSQFHFLICTSLTCYVTVFFKKFCETVRKVLSWIWLMHING